jgi:hypothetical protein
VAKTNAIILSSNAGELSPLMDQRIDQEKHRFGCRTLENFTPLIYGASERRPGTEYIAGQKSNSAKGRVVAFEHSVDDTYILLFENQVLRFFKSGKQVFIPFGTEDLSSIGSIVAHWLCDDNLGDTVVIDDDGATHNGVASANTDTLTAADESGTANKAFDLGTAESVAITDHADFTFGDGSNDSAFSLAAWGYYNASANTQTIISKRDPAADEEWWFEIRSDGRLNFQIFDESATATCTVTGSVVAAAGWHFFVATYDGRGGATAADGMNVYIDWVKDPNPTRGNAAAYVAMEDKTQDVLIGAQYSAANFRLWEDKIHNVAVFSKELSAAEVASLVGNDSSTAYEITTPYLTADLPELKLEQSADVMYITHPDYEPRRLSRFGDAAWLLQVTDIQTGPFRAENDDTAKTITASATTGSVTLTAAGHSPFISGTTAGHLPSGAVATSKSQTGALFRLVHSRSIGAYRETLTDNYTNDQTENISWVHFGTLAKDTGWSLVTTGTWNGTLEIQRNYTIGAAHGASDWETVFTFISADDRNVSTTGTSTTDIETGTERESPADYRAILTASGDAAEQCHVNFTITDTDQTGIVEITAVASPQSATATVLSTLGDTTATFRWSEGSFSNYRGWPIDVTISAEERLTFAGNKSKPLSTWGSATGDFTDFSLGTADDDAVNFTLVGTGQQNRIRWILSKDVLIIGTVGGEHLLGASKNDEALTPTNVRARLQTTHGSENIAAIPINQAVIFAQRGGKKIRELLYDFNSDSYKADDLTIFANHILGLTSSDGIVDWAYQRTPEPMLWCIRNDGEMAVMSYERDQKVFAWSRYVTVDSTGDSDFESVAVIYGGTRAEDEVWVTVKRTINSGTVRYVERFKPRNWGSDDEDAFFVDSGATYDSTSTTAMTGATHLAGETVAIYADGAKQTPKTVAGNGTFTLETAASKVQYGLAYTSTFKPMKLNISNLGLATTKKITRGVLSFYKTIRGEWGSDVDKLDPIIYRRAGVTTDEFPMFTGDIEMPFRSGYSRGGDIIIRQADPLPMTILALTLDVGVAND